MSADNFNAVVKRDDGRWAVYLNLSASDDTWTQIDDLGRSMWSFASSDEACRWAEAQGYTEYGTQIVETPLRRGRVRLSPKPDGHPGPVLTVADHGEIWLDPTDLDDLRHLLIEDLALEVDRLRASRAELVDEIVYALLSAIDVSDAWGAAQRDPDALRDAVKRVLESP